MRADYLTITNTGENEIIIQKSRFIAHIARATTEEEALIFIQDIKKEHYQATHNCSAYLIGEHNEIQKANDDGEPSGTAGVPMLEVLKKQKLQDVVVVVTRYFGGIKLGSGGLIRAYGRAVSEAVSAVGLVHCQAHAVMQVTVDYNWLGKVENEVRQSTYPIKTIDYVEDVSLYLYVPITELPVFETWMTELTNGKAEIIQDTTCFLELPVP